MQTGHPWSPYSLLANSPEWDPASLLIFHTPHYSGHEFHFSWGRGLTSSPQCWQFYWAVRHEKEWDSSKKVRANDEVWQSDRQKIVEMFKFSFWTQDRSQPHFTSGGLAHRFEAAFKWFKSFRHFGLLYASGRLLHPQQFLRLAKWQNMAIPSQKVPGPMSDGFRLRWQHTENSKVLILYHLILPDTWCTTMHPDAKL